MRLHRTQWRGVLTGLGWGAVCGLAIAGCQPGTGAMPDAEGTRGDAASEANAPGPDSAANDAGTSDAVEGDAEVCTTPVAMRPPGAVCVRTVTGRATDLAGAPLMNAVVTFCSAACFATQTDNTGMFRVGVGDFLPLAQYSVQVHGRPEHASVFVPAPTMVGSDDVLTIADPIRVPRYTDVGGEFAEMITADLELTAGDVTVRAAAGTQTVIDFEDIDLGMLGRQLRAARVPLAQAPAAFRAANVVALWALAPFKMTASMPLAVRVRNPDAAMFPAGSAVEFVALGATYYPPPGNAGTIVPVGSGRVSADGATIATDSGVGLRELTWLGVRPRR